ncbi:MAG: DNA mismatch repair protein MutS [Rhodospirillaceae bacterium]|nr:MAG: DNA mismatch repair protein MutS [Rhodospirillaceae bacterium]
MALDRDSGDDTGDDQEDALWRRVKEASQPLLGKKRLVPEGAASPRKASAPLVAAPPVVAPPVVVPPVAAPVKAPLAVIGGGLDRRSAERLRRGQMAIAATLDLHGLTQAEAHSLLNRYLLHAQKAGKRTVLVITGKGTGKAGGGVLRANVPRWLGLPPLSNLVLETAPARGRHGGDGALYVLLRKLKQSR